MNWAIFNPAFLKKSRNDLVSRGAGFLFRAVLDFVYPPRCVVCGEWMDSWTVMCAKCAGDLRRVEHPLCPTCGKPFISAPYDHLCSVCSQDEQYFDAQRSAIIYEGQWREAILKFKFNGVTSLAKTLADATKNIFETEFKEIQVDSIVPVPLHPTRLRWRGFNQSLTLARRIAKERGFWIDPYSLVRSRPTTPQVRLTPKQREENVKGAFAVARPNFIDGRNILLIDDVTTTGSTLRECSKVLKKAGASKVYALTVARAE
jgi:ComF family protein